MKKLKRGKYLVLLALFVSFAMSSSNFTNLVKAEGEKARVIFLNNLPKFKDRARKPDKDILNVERFNGDVYQIKPSQDLNQASVGEIKSNAIESMLSRYINYRILAGAQVLRDEKGKITAFKVSTPESYMAASLIGALKGTMPSNHKFDKTYEEYDAKENTSITQPSFLDYVKDTAMLSKIADESDNTRQHKELNSNNLLSVTNSSLINGKLPAPEKSDYLDVRPMNEPFFGIDSWIQEGIDYFYDADGNLEEISEPNFNRNLGHRMTLLSPNMKWETFKFGMQIMKDADSSLSSAFVASMHPNMQETTAFAVQAYPSPGVFPTEYINSKSSMWSIWLDGRDFKFDPATDELAIHFQALAGAGENEEANLTPEGYFTDFSQADCDKFNKGETVKKDHLQIEKRSTEDGNSYICISFDPPKSQKKATVGSKQMYTDNNSQAVNENSLNSSYIVQIKGVSAKGYVNAPDGTKSKDDEFKKTDLVYSVFFRDYDSTRQIDDFAEVLLETDVAMIQNYHEASTVMQKFYAGASIEVTLDEPGETGNAGSTETKPNPDRTENPSNPGSSNEETEKTDSTEKKPEPGDDSSELDDGNDMEGNDLEDDDLEGDEDPQPGDKKPGQTRPDNSNKNTAAVEISKDDNDSIALNPDKKGKHDDSIIIDLTGDKKSDESDKAKHYSSNKYSGKDKFMGDRVFTSGSQRFMPIYNPINTGSQAVQAGLTPNANAAQMQYITSNAVVASVPQTAERNLDIYTYAVLILALAMIGARKIIRR